jgi:hypothetical protein
MQRKAEPISSSGSQIIDAQLAEILNNAENIAKKAQRNNRPLTGGGFYASKFSEAQAEALLSFRRLSSNLSKFDDLSIKNATNEIEGNLNLFFDPKSKSTRRGESRKRINFLIKTIIEPAMTAAPTYMPSDEFFPLEIVRETRGYIERVAEQACGSYDQSWYDAAAVMVRRLLETLIIETFEAHNLVDKIKNSDGSFFYLRDLITALLNEKSWNIGRNVRKALPELKDVGDQSAHSRRYLAKKSDLDKIRRELRVTIEELVHLSKLKK